MTYNFYFYQTRTISKAFQRQKDSTTNNYSSQLRLKYGPTGKIFKNWLRTKSKFFCTSVNAFKWECYSFIRSKVFLLISLQLCPTWLTCFRMLKWRKKMRRWKRFTVYMDLAIKRDLAGWLEAIQQRKDAVLY